MPRAVLAVVPLVATLAAVGYALSSVSCSVVLSPGQEQCQTAKDCTARGFPATAECQANVCVADPVWGCLGNVPNPTPNPDLKVSFSVQLQTLEQDPVSEATVDVCDKVDLNCTSTNPSYPKGIKPDGMGNVTLTVPQGFDGFVRVTSPETLDARVFVGRPLMAPPNVKAVRLIQPSDYQTLIAYAGLKLDMTRGTAIFLVEDCSTNGAAGVTFACSTADAESQSFYLINQDPIIKANATDADGFGGVLNLPVGSSIGSATLADGGAYVGQTTFDVLAYTISYALITPTPQTSPTTE